MKILAENRVARHEYFIDDTYEAGISLDGGEVKSVRAGSVNLRDSFCVIKNAEVFIKNMHIAVYDKSGAFNTSDSKRDRRLLLHKSEIRRLIGKVNEKGYTLVPLKIYLKQSLIKVEVGLCKGKHTYDKKQSIKERDLDRSARKDVKNYGI
ncbi:MAG: SsrA-binding protein SmpB [Candidatus Borkfalkiaceae bacterium]|nr:SsrA-binding protein SmpB [bacterium]MDY2851320.1 SsrA-binding protein SmpB [Christensenellaceae bacterium]